MGPGLHGQNPETELTPPGHRQGLGGRTPPTPPPALASQLLLSSPGMPPIPASWPAAEGTSLQGATLVPARCAPARSVPGAESQNLEEGLESVPLGEGAEAPRQGPTCPNPCLAVQLWGALGDGHGVRGMGLGASTGWAPRGGEHGAWAMCWPHDGSTWGARMAPAMWGQAAEP